MKTNESATSSPSPFVATEDRRAAARHRHFALTALKSKLTIMASGTASSMALTIVQSVIVARLLGPRQLASYAAISVSALAVGQLSDLGLANAFAYYARRQPGAIKSLLRIFSRHLMGCVLLTSAAAILASWVPNAAIQEVLSIPWFAVVVVAYVTLSTAATVLPGFLLACGRYSAYVTYANVTVAVQLSLILVCALLVGPSWRGFITAAACAQAIVVALVFRDVFRRSRMAATESVSARQCYGYALRIKWAEVMKLLSGRIDLLVVAAALPAAQVGTYSVVLSFREFGMAPLRMYAGILQNMLVDRDRVGANSRVLILGSLTLQCIISLVASLGAAVCLPVLLPLMYGARFADAVTPAVFGVFGTVFLSVAGVCWIVFNMSGRPQTTSGIVTVSGIIGPPLVFALAVRYGLKGAAFAGVVTGAITCVISLFMLIRLRRYTLGDLVVALQGLRSLVTDFKRAAPADAIPSAP